MSSKWLHVVKYKFLQHLVVGLVLKTTDSLSLLFINVPWHLKYCCPFQWTINWRDVTSNAGFVVGWFSRCCVENILPKTFIVVTVVACWAVTALLTRLLWEIRALNFPGLFNAGSFSWTKLSFEFGVPLSLDQFWWIDRLFREYPSNYDKLLFNIIITYCENCYWIRVVDVWLIFCRSVLPKVIRNFIFEW